ncbi:3-hydroxyacyl-CoA dehydrogenase NAD-binding domain-containing protein [Acinetobacter guillouiae]|uniref:3-hydroxyacyl-CoA dehydrogenase NAD-binding domain-containing protein n=1 Tax=Acinetobacter guillouiae TaxID=106649 RepID=UPI00124F97AA|nr:3-hydroxyacyl-CoA dehydrogenase NAD-binding domain-containing protein [Acinetobacter guillouiae]
MKPINKVAIIGTGVIGASWAAFYLSKGFQVSAFDPAVDAELNLKNRVQTYLLDLFELAEEQTTSSDHYVSDTLKNLNFYQNLADAVKDADFIQENGPERIDLKKDLYAQLTQNCPKDSIIASSSSGLKISDIQHDCLYPERIVLGHPFNPPHLLPLVEIIGGEKTQANYIHDAFEFYRLLGKKPILIQKEVKGHVANRLQSAIWREAFYLVSEGVCSAEDIDIAITNGPGLRWAIFGPYLNMQLANQHGFKAAMHHLGEPMSEWWADMHPYTLSEEKIEMLNEETQQFVKKLGDKNLQLLRDQALLRSLKMRKELDLP